MELPKLIILVCCTYYSMASHHSHTIPIEGYETELEYLGQHVEIPETPVKVVKITKTVAVKIPVPYPVKVREKVPYPVHVAKPYPVPVPQIIKVPQIVSPKSGHTYGSAESEQGGSQNLFQANNHQGNGYSIDEAHEPSDEGGSFDSFPNVNSYNGGNSGYNQNFGSYNNEEADPGSYGAPSNTYENSNNGFETQNYDQVLNPYLNNQIQSASGGSNNGHYH